MSVFRWRGTTSTNIGDGRNWVNDTGTPYASGSLPVAGDYVYFDTVPTAQPSGGALSDNLEGLFIGSAFTGTIGAAATPLTAGVSGECIVAASKAGAVFLSGAGVGLGNLKVIGSAGTTTIAGSGSNFFMTGGNVTLSGSVFTGSFTVDGQQSVLTIASNVTLPTTVTINAGMITNNVAVTTLAQNGGALSQYGAVTTLTQMGGTYLWYNGNIGTATINGTLDATLAVTTRTMTTAYLMANGRLKLDELASADVTNLYANCVQPWIQLQVGRKIVIT
jgi:hypothetical protein